MSGAKNVYLKDTGDVAILNPKSSSSLESSGGTQFPSLSHLPYPIEFIQYSSRNDSNIRGGIFEIAFSSI